MKKVIVIGILCMAGFSATAQKVNEKIQIESSGSWYDGTILKVNGDQYFVTYDGWGDSWNEWVPVSRIRGFATAPAPTEKLYKVGDRVETEYGMIPEPGTIIEVGENKYHIQFDKKAFGSKWVTEKQIKKL